MPAARRTGMTYGYAHFHLSPTALIMPQVIIKIAQFSDGTALRSLSTFLFPTIDASCIGDARRQDCVPDYPD